MSKVLECGNDPEIYKLLTTTGWVNYAYPQAPHLYPGASDYYSSPDLLSFSVNPAFVSIL